MVEPDHPIGMVGAAVPVAWCIGTGQRQPVDRPVDAVEVGVIRFVLFSLNLVDLIHYEF